MLFRRQKPKQLAINFQKRKKSIIPIKDLSFCILTVFKEELLAFNGTAP
jgi:hypothetical protein